MTVQVTHHIAVSEIRTANIRTTVGKFETTFTKLQDKVTELAVALAKLEQRCAALEKHTDRTWQVWLALIAAGVAVIVSLVKK